MSLLPIIFLALEVLIIAAGIIIGYKRGTGKSLIRLIYLIVIGAISFAVARAIAFSISPVITEYVLPLLPDDIIKLFDTSSEIVAILENLVGALIAPFALAIVFAILQLMSMICFNLISSKIVRAITKTDEESSASKWGGLAIGCVSGLLVATVLLAPLFTVIHVSETISSNTVSEVENILEPKPSSNALKATPILAKKDLKIIKAFPLNEFLIHKITSYNVVSSTSEDKVKDTAVDAIPVILDVAANASHVINVTLECGGDTLDVISNAIASTVPYIDRSPTVCALEVEAMITLAKTLKNGGTILGMGIKEYKSSFANTISNQMLDTLSRTDRSSVKANIITVFGDLNHSIVILPDGTVSIIGDIDTNLHINSHSNGILSVVSALNFGESSDEDSKESFIATDEVADALRNMAKNQNMTPVVNEVRDHIVGTLDNKGIDITDEKFDSMYGKIADDLTNTLEDNIASNTLDIDSVSEDIESIMTGVFEKYDIEIKDAEKSIIATCVASNFMTDEYINNSEVNISQDDIMAFFQGVQQGK